MQKGVEKLELCSAWILPRSHSHFKVKASMTDAQHGLSVFQKLCSMEHDAICLVDMRNGAVTTPPASISLLDLNDIHYTK